PRNTIPTRKSAAVIVAISPLRAADRSGSAAGPGVARSALARRARRPCQRLPLIRRSNCIVQLDHLIQGLQVDLLALHLGVVPMLGYRVRYDPPDQSIGDDKLVPGRRPAAVTVVHPRFVVVDTATNVRTNIVRRPYADQDVTVIACGAPAVLHAS